jgi:hypothetical protein
MCLDFNAFKAENKQASVFRSTPVNAQTFFHFLAERKCFWLQNMKYLLYISLHVLMHKCYPYDVEWLKHRKFAFSRRLLTSNLKKSAWIEAIFQTCLQNHSGHYMALYMFCLSALDLSTQKKDGKQLCRCQDVADESCLVTKNAL